MKHLEASASTTVAAPLERAYELLADVERYPTWYPEVVRTVDVVERSAPVGAVRRARTRLHASLGPIERDFDLLLRVETAGPDLVRLARVPHEPDDPERFEVTWRLGAQAALIRIDLALVADLDVPRLVPVGGLGDSIARGFVEAAARALGAP